MARAYAWARIALGAALALAPTASMRPWIGNTAADADVHGPLRSLAIRDALLGVAVLRAQPESPEWRRALRLCAIADTIDAGVCIADYARTRRPGAGLAALAAAGGAAIGFSR